jgi:hypothetical protein
MDETKNVTFNAFDRDAEIESSERIRLHWFQADAARRPKVTNHFEQQKGTERCVPLLLVAPWIRC